MPHKAVFFHIEHAGEGGKEYLSANEALKAAGVEVAFLDDVLDKDHIPTDPNFDIAGVFVESAVDEETVGKLPALKFITTLSTGYDHIDRAAAAAHGIQASYVPSYGENTVAEFTFALILSLSRKICEAHRRVREEGDFTTDGLRGFDLAGKTIGVVGTGRIGRHVVRIAKGFEMNVVAYDPFPDEAFAREAEFEYKPLPELLQMSDIVSLHVPYMPATHHLMNTDTFKLMKKGAYLINTSRGAIVDTKALLVALDEKHLGGAGLDVLEEEGVMKNERDDLVKNRMKEHDLAVLLENHVLVDMPNVIVTPHNAFNTKEAFLRILAVTVENIVNFTKGTPTNLIK